MTTYVHPRKYRDLRMNWIFSAYSERKNYWHYQIGEVQLDARNTTARKFRPQWCYLVLAKFLEILPKLSTRTVWSLKIALRPSYPLRVYQISDILGGLTAALAAHHARRCPPRWVSGVSNLLRSYRPRSFRHNIVLKYLENCYKSLQ